MAKDASKSKAKAEPTLMRLPIEMPRLPADFRGAQYSNHVTISASAEEIFLDLFQGGPEAGGHSEGRIVFVGRIILPLILAKTIISQLQGLVEHIEKDKGIELPGPEEVNL